MLEPIRLWLIQTVASMSFIAQMQCVVRQGVGAQIMTVVNYAHFAQTSLEV